MCASWNRESPSSRTNKINNQSLCCFEQDSFEFKIRTKHLRDLDRRTSLLPSLFIRIIIISTKTIEIKQLAKSRNANTNLQNNQSTRLTYVTIVKHRRFFETSVVPPARTAAIPAGITSVATERGRSKRREGKREGSAWKRMDGANDNSRNKQMEKQERA